MQVQLKQAEIVESIKQYLVKQGIVLTGRSVDISFTAGRKETGLSADISIEDTQLPDLTEPAERPALSVVKTEAEAEAAPTPPEPEGEATSKSLFG